MPNHAEFVTLPARWSTWQRRKNTLLLRMIRAAAWVIGRLPIFLVRPFGHMLGSLMYVLGLPFFGRIRHRLRQAFPKKSWQARERLLWGMWCHLGCFALELGHLDTLTDEVRVRAGGEAILRDAARAGRGGIVISGHVGHWELLAQWAAKKQLPLWTFAKPLYDPRLTHWVDHERSRLGLKIIWRGEDASSRKLLGALRQGGLVAMLIDQDTRVDGTFVPFFGKLAHTATAPARLAIRRRLPLMMAVTRRVHGGHEVDVRQFDLPPEPTDAASLEAQVTALTTEITCALEEAICQAPSQWVWLHDRWRQRPPPGGEALGQSDMAQT